MSDNHSNPNEGIEQLVNQATYRGVPLVAMATTQKGYYAVSGNTMTPPIIDVVVQPSAQVKALIDASLDAAPPADPTPPPSDPVEPPPPTDTSGFQPPASATWKGITGLQVIPPSCPATPPAKGQCTTDPVTGADEYRLTDVADVPGATGSLIVYPRYTPVSTDGRWLFRHDTNSTSSCIVDLKDLSIARKLTDADGKPIGEINEIRWDYTGSQPTVHRYVKGKQFWMQDIATGKNTLIRDFSDDFPDAGMIMNDVEGDSSHDSNIWCWMAMAMPQKGSYYPVAIFTYDVAQDKILGKLTFENWGLPAGATTGERLPRPNMVEISPDGTRALIDWNRCWVSGGQQVDGNLVGTHADGPHVYPLDFDTTKAVKVGVSATHSGWAQRASDGAWMFVSQNNREDFIEACDMIEGWNPDGTGSMIRMLTHGQLGYGAGNPVNAVGMHFGKFYSFPGYAIMSTYSLIETEPGDNQLMLLPLENACTPIRVCPLNNVYRGEYRDEGSAAVGPDNLTFYWTSNFGQPTEGDSTGFREVCATRLPRDWTSRLEGA